MRGLVRELHHDLGYLTMELARAKGGCDVWTMVAGAQVTMEGGGALGSGKILARVHLPTG